MNAVFAPQATKASTTQGQTAANSAIEISTTGPEQALSPAGASLRSLRDALDDCPRVQSQMALQRMLNEGKARPQPLRPAPRATTATAPVQAVWVIRGGADPIWEDPYVPQPGDTFPPQFAQQPNVLMDKGKTEVRFDSSGAQSTVRRTDKVPTHKKMQSTRREEGGKLRERLKQNPAMIVASTADLAKLAEQLEKSAGRSVPKNHKEKIEKLSKQDSIEGDEFRAVTKSQDEFTQSQSSSHFLTAFGQQGGDTPQIHRDELAEYRRNLLRVMSALRAPTESIVAPIAHGGKTTGQQHPTSDDQPTLTGGASGHSYADRRRVESQIKIFDAVIKDTNAPPNAIVLGSILSAVVSTLSSMSAPTSATNLPSFHKSRQEQQVEERERIKEQANIIAERLGIKVDTSVQDYDAIYRAHPTPTSPRRESAAATKLKRTTTPSTPSASTVSPGSTVPTTSIVATGSTPSNVAPTLNNLSPSPPSATVTTASSPTTTSKPPAPNKPTTPSAPSTPSITAPAPQTPLKISPTPSVLTASAPSTTPTIVTAPSPTTTSKLPAPIKPSAPSTPSTTPATTPAPQTPLKISPTPSVLMASTPSTAPMIVTAPSSPTTSKLPALIKPTVPSAPPTPSIMPSVPAPQIPLKALSTSGASTPSSSVTASNVPIASNQTAAPKLSTISTPTEPPSLSSASNALSTSNQSSAPAISVTPTTTNRPSSTSTTSVGIGTVTSTTTPPTLSGMTSTPIAIPIEQLVDEGRAIRYTIQQIVGALPLIQQIQTNQPLQAFARVLIQVHDAVGLIDMTNQANLDILRALAGVLNDQFRYFENLVQRARVGHAAAENPTAQGGERIPSLQQFFAECGQMAAHNALVLANFPAVATPQQLYDQTLLRQRGGFENNITEEHIRGIISRAGRPDIPVLGNLAQASGLVDLLRDGNVDEVLAHQIGLVEQRGLISIIDFIRGDVDSLVLVVNTVGAKGENAVGYHWITVRVTREQNGALAVQYLDSLNAPADYADLFEALRAMLTDAPQQQQHGMADDFSAFGFEPFPDFDPYGSNQGRMSLHELSDLRGEEVPALKTQSQPSVTLAGGTAPSKKKVGERPTEPPPAPKRHKSETQPSTTGTSGTPGSSQTIQSPTTPSHSFFQPQQNVVFGSSNQQPQRPALSQQQLPRLDFTTTTPPPSATSLNTNMQQTHQPQPSPSPAHHAVLPLFQPPLNSNNTPSNKPQTSQDS